MKVFFSTLFDSPSYPHNIFLEDGVAVGAIHIGPAGLLHFLELHLGVPVTESSTIQRIFQYHRYLQSKGFSVSKLLWLRQIFNPPNRLTLSFIAFFILSSPALPQAGNKRSQGSALLN